MKQACEMLEIKSYNGLIDACNKCHAVLFNAGGAESVSGPYAVQQQITVSLFADDWVDEVYWNGQDIRHKMSDSGSTCNVVKQLTFDYDPTREEQNRPVLAVAANDNQPGTSASFTLRCESTAGW